MNECTRKVQETEISLVWARWGTWGVRRLEIFRDGWRAPEREHLFLSVGALLGGLFFGDPEGGLRGWTLFF
jgi:hypothetical protein